MAQLSLDLADLISRIEQAEERWLELSELVALSQELEPWL